MQEKVEFASSAWLKLAETILVDLVRTYGKPEDEFSVCEVFFNVPEQVSAEGTVAWHFYISGRNVEVGIGEAEDVEVRMAAQYEEALAVAKLVYTAEDVANAKREQVQEQDTTQPPEYLTELHNRLAVLTA